MKKLKFTALALLSASLFAFTGCSACDTEESPSTSNGASEIQTSKDLDVNVVNEEMKLGDVLKIEAKSNSGTAIVFTSLNEAVATVDATGLVTAKSVGTAFILITAGEAEKTVKISVVQDSYGVTLNQTDINLLVGARHELKATLTKNGVAYEDEQVTWSFEATEGTLADIADCTFEGNRANIQAKAVGSITATATLGSVSASCEITVLNASATALSSPVVTVTDCDTLAWTAIDGAEGYEVKINDGQWLFTNETTYSVAEEADGGEDFKVQVKAVSAYNNFDNYDSEPTLITVEHDWDEGTSETVATCTTPATVVFQCETCEREKVVEGHYEDHNYADVVADLYAGVTDGKYGVCTVCGEAQSPAVQYTYDQASNSYIVSGIDLVALEAVTDGAIYVASTYDDGEHGELPVTALGKGAFAKVRSIKRLYLPTSVTLIGSDSLSYCSSLEFLAMPGVTKTWESSKDAETGETKLGFNNACYRSSNIKEVIVNKDFRLSVQMFATDYNNSAKTVNLFVLGGADESNVFVQGNNNMLTGAQFYLPRNPEQLSCKEWVYNADGSIDYVEDHVFEDGACTRCGTVDGQGIVYVYGTAKNGDGKEVNGYIVNGLDEFEGTVVNVLKEYNDGVHGTLPVIGVEKNAFLNNTVITKVILPETVYSIGSSAFQQCAALETVIMPGVVSNASKSINQLADNSFLDCPSLTTIVVSELWANATQIFLVRTDRISGYEAKLDVYVTKAKTETSVRYQNWIDRPETVNLVKQNMFTNNTYYYDQSAACGTWKWNGGVYGGEIVLQPPHDYDENDKCTVCGAWDPKGIEYTYGTVTLANTLTVGEEKIQNFTGYIVKGLLDTHTGTVVTVPDTFDDGVNGEANVISVAANAFMRNKTITKVILSENVLVIGGSAFQECTALQTVIMPGVIDKYAGDGTGGSNIGANAFLDCSALETLVVSTLNQTMGQYFWVRTEGYTAKVKVYRYNTDGTADFGSSCRFTNHTQANMFVTSTPTDGKPTADELAKGGYYLYSEVAPTAEQWETTEYWWHFVDGEVVVWTKA